MTASGLSGFQFNFSTTGVTWTPLQSLGSGKTTKGVAATVGISWSGTSMSNGTIMAIYIPMKSTE